MEKGIMLYNLYPKLVGSIDKWVEHLDRIKDMNFNWIYLNPIHSPGFSGSDYSVKNYYLYHPIFVTGEMDFSNLEAQKHEGDRKLRNFCNKADELGIKIMMDLVINHTGIDCELTKKHPEWYKKNKDGSIKNPGALDGEEWVSWGDLADIDNEETSDKDGLWEYWLDMILHYCSLGIRGFRCDAAYHIPSSLWKFLIPKIKAEYPDALFLGETLGCQNHELVEVAESGFDIIMNSFKWWDFKEKWFLKQYKQWAGKYLSLTFPENHDTIRFAEEYKGDKEKAILHYGLQAFFCSSIAITIGFEYGFRRKINVVKTNPGWWESGSYDISEEIKEINLIKSKYKVLLQDNMIHIKNLGENVFAFTKESVDKDEMIYLIANLSGEKTLQLEDIFETMKSKEIADISPKDRLENIENSFEFCLKPNQIKLFYSKLKD